MPSKLSNKTKLVKLGFHISEEKHRALKIKSATEGILIKDILNKLLDDYLNKDKKRKSS